MLRTATTRPVFQSLTKASFARKAYSSAIPNGNLKLQIQSLKGRRPRAALVAPISPITTSLLRYATKDGPPFDKVDTKAESKQRSKTLKSDPASVSEASSVRQVFESSQSTGQDTDIHGGIRGDLDTIKDTFALTHVPREAYLIGGAGVLPYLATSLSTVYLAYDINRSHAGGNGLIFSADTAHQILDFITPIQIGYGAVIISFLGAIHWGLEFAGYGGYHSYRRYAIGVVAPAVAWPTMLMPIEYALITQFLAFNVLYFTDARASVGGLAPPWYSTYRFVLTFVVGASIVVSLVGRGQIAEKDQNIAGPVDKMKALRDSQWENLEREERERRQRIAKEEEEAEAKKNEDDNEDGDDDKEAKNAKSKGKDESGGKDGKDKTEGGKGNKDKDESEKGSKDNKDGEEKGDKGGNKDKKDGKSK